MKHVLTRLDAKNYLVDGTIKGTYWHETKTGKDWIKLPKDNPTGRQYIGQKDADAMIDENGQYEFETKTSGPRILGTRLTENAIARIKELEKQIKTIKEDPANHLVPTKIDMTTPEGLAAAAKIALSKMTPEARERALSMFGEI